MSKLDREAIAEMTTEVVAAYISNNKIGSTDIPDLIVSVHGAISGFDRSEEKGQNTVKLRPAVPIRKSITDDYIVCLEDGKRFRSLKRHLGKLGMTPAEYRAKWGLPDTYPMVAPGYTRALAAVAKETGLGSTARRR